MFRQPSSTLLTATILVLAGSAQVHAHVAPWARGIWECTEELKEDSGVPANPLVNRTKFDQEGKDGWWFHGGRCIKYRPPQDQFLELPAGGQFTVEMAGNKVFTTLALTLNNEFVKEFGENKDQPLREINGSQCMTTPNLHAHDEKDAAGYAFAISYQSDVGKVTLENLVIFTTKYYTPYRRIATFDVPADMPECPEGGCICAALWIPNHCGEANEYMIGYNCRVTNVKPTARALGTAKTPVWCEGEPDKCIKGPKGMIVFAQQEGNNINIDGNQKDGQLKSPGYNQKTGFADGAQNDIFVDSARTVAAVAVAPQPTLGHCRRHATAKNRMG